ncbi:MAG TPA: IS21 family transposase [bacterium]|nr:IS21 family transposase [bacterium]
MAGRRIKVIDIREMLRCLRMKESNRRIAKMLGINRRTVSKYRQWANWHNLLEGELPSLEIIEKFLEESGMIGIGERKGSKVVPYHDRVEELISKNCSIQVIYERLRDNYGFKGSYDSVRRYIKNIREKESDKYFRIETAPGEEAQVDFGYSGLMYDFVEKRLRKAWCFGMVLSYSRHIFVKFVFDQKISTWLRLQQDGFEYFEGVVKKVVLDNLKAAVVKAAVYDTVLQRSYLEFAEHYGFLVSPCRIGTPRHKGKVKNADQRSGLL